MTEPPLFAPLPFELLDLSLIDDDDLIEQVHTLTLEANSDDDQVTAITELRRSRWPSHAWTSYRVFPRVAEVGMATIEEMEEVVIAFWQEVQSNALQNLANPMMNPAAGDS
jgi:hypothetical protein